MPVGDATIDSNSSYIYFSFKDSGCIKLPLTGGVYNKLPVSPTWQLFLKARYGILWHTCVE